MDQRIEETIVHTILEKDKFQGPKQQGLVEICSNEVPIRHLCPQTCQFCVLYNIQHQME